MPTKSFYEILNSKPTASFEELRRNYKQLILQCHPDKLQHIHNTDTKTKRNTASANGDNATTITNIAAAITPAAVDLNAEISISTSSDQNSEQFVAINEAWNTLKDPVKRRHYDAELLLRKFQTHSNIFARLTLNDMKRCAATATTNSGSDSGSDSDSEVACEDGIEGKSIAGDMYWYYTYDCRCGGQYIVDESVDSEILNRNQKRTPNRHSASKTSEEQKLTQQQKQNNSDKNIQAAADSGAENASTSKCGNNSKSVGAGVYEDIQGPATANRDVDDGAADDEDGEVLVECSECSLVIVLT